MRIHSLLEMTKQQRPLLIIFIENAYIFA